MASALAHHRLDPYSLQDESKRRQAINHNPYDLADQNRQLRRPGAHPASDYHSLLTHRQTIEALLHIKSIHQVCVEAASHGPVPNYVNGANIAGFLKVAHAMMDQGVV